MFGFLSIRKLQNIREDILVFMSFWSSACPIYRHEKKVRDLIKPELLLCFIVPLKIKFTILFLLFVKNILVHFPQVFFSFLQPLHLITITLWHPSRNLSLYTFYGYSLKSVGNPYNNLLHCRYLIFSCSTFVNSTISIILFG